MEHPTGQQYGIVHGDWEATVTEVGAHLRSLRHRSRELLWTFGESEPPHNSQGAQLTPWPNRIRDGRWELHGVVHQLPINEPERGTALHGLATDKPWQVIGRDEALVRQRLELPPQEGWPGTLEVELVHSVTDEGLVVEFLATNTGELPVPCGYGAHPYFAFPLAESSLEVPFSKELLVDDRLLPLEVADVTPERDFRQARVVGEVALDTAFTAPATPRWEVVVHGPPHGVRIFDAGGCDWLQIFTDPTREAIAIEPMTCGPDAFNPGPTHTSDIMLEPGATVGCRWGVGVTAQ